MVLLSRKRKSVLVRRTVEILTRMVTTKVQAIVEMVAEIDAGNQARNQGILVMITIESLRSKFECLNIFDLVITRMKIRKFFSSYDREREYDDDYYYGRRGADYEDSDRRDASYRDEDRRHTSRDDLDRSERDRDRHSREEHDRRGRAKDEIDDRDGRRRLDKTADPRHMERGGREYDPRYPRDPRDRDYLERDRRRDDRRSRRYPEYDPRDPRESYRREYYGDTFNTKYEFFLLTIIVPDIIAASCKPNDLFSSSRPSSRSSYNERERDYYPRSRDPYSSYGYNSKTNINFINISSS